MASRLIWINFLHLFLVALSFACQEWRLAKAYEATGSRSVRPSLH